MLSSSGSSSASSEASFTGSFKHSNRLVKESSPYLLQHAHNPVDWYPWGEEAFEKARIENKPIFLSIGYSTCHWCHVMEKESFENEEIASLMNKHFVNIKVDREERPDIDRVYMTFVQLTTGGGGWPLNCFLTPSLKPIFGGTYFPPTESIYRGHVSFPSLLNRIHNMWTNKREDLMSQSEKVVSILKKAFTEKDNHSEDAEMTPTKTASHILKFAHEYVASTVEDFLSTFDTVEGGYSQGAPKFPRPVVMDFLLRSYYEEKDDRRKLDIKNSLMLTLDKMARGGIYDHLGGGFHRYSVDTYWHVPHFEKMMYDQGQLAIVYAEAYKATGNEFYKQILEEILLYIERDMSLAGESSDMIGFYSAEDADSLPTFDSKEKQEGAFYAWDYQQVVDILDTMVPHIGSVKPSEIFTFMFNMRVDGNVRQSSDPHGELGGLNVLCVGKTLKETQEHFNSIPPEAVSNTIMDCKDILFKERNKMKPRPHLDDKIITSWNAYVISAFARSALLLSEPGYLKIAERTANFIYEKLYDSQTKILYRIFKKNSEKERNIEGFLCDYANMISALIDLYESSGSVRWLNWAFELQEVQDLYFYDHENGGYFEERGNDPTIIYRLKETSDSAEPSGNSVSCMNLVRLRNYDINKQVEYEEKLSKLFELNAGFILEHPNAIPGVMSALARLTCGRESHIALVFDKTVTNLKPIMEEIVKETVESHRSLVFVNRDDEECMKFISERLPYLKDAKVLNNRTTIILCKNNTCNLPTNDIEIIQHLSK